MHLVLSLRGTIEARVHGESAPSACAGIITAPDVEHEIDQRFGESLLVFIEPESAIGVALRSVIGGSARRVTERERDEIVAISEDPMAIMDAAGVRWTRAVAMALGASAEPSLPVAHPAVLEALALLRGPLDDELCALGAMAAKVGLSDGRFMHAFTESVGIPWRPYVLWLRVQRAVAAIADGVALSAAAADAGFSDAAHMSRTFRKTLGLTPVQVRATIAASLFKTPSAG